MVPYEAACISAVALSQVSPRDHKRHALVFACVSGWSSIHHDQNDIFPEVSTRRYLVTCKRQWVNMKRDACGVVGIHFLHSVHIFVFARGLLCTCAWLWGVPGSPISGVYSPVISPCIRVFTQVELSRDGERVDFIFVQSDALLCNQVPQNSTCKVAMPQS